MNDQAMRVLIALGDPEYTDAKFGEVLRNLTDSDVLLSALKVRVHKLTTAILRGTFSNQNVTEEIIDFAVDNAYDYDTAARAVNTNVSFRAKQALLRKLPEQAAFVFMGDETVLNRAQVGAMSADNLVLAEKFIRVYGFDEAFAERWHSRWLFVATKRTLVSQDEYSSGLLTVYPAILLNTANEQILNNNLNPVLLRNPNLSVEQAKAIIVKEPEVLLNQAEQEHYSDAVKQLLSELDRLPLQELKSGAAPEHLIKAARRKTAYPDSLFATAQVDVYEKNYNNLVARIARTKQKVLEGEAKQETLTLLEARLRRVRLWRGMNAAVAHLS